MLWLAAAGGFVAWQATRRRRARRTAGVFFCQSGLSSENESGVVFARTGLVSQTRSSLVELKDSLSYFCGNTASCENAIDVDNVNDALLRGEEALPWLCKLLEISGDPQVLTDVTEIMALLSPSRHGLQAAIFEAGAVPLLLRLLEATLPGQRPPQTPAAPESPPSEQPPTHQPQATASRDLAPSIAKGDGVVSSVPSSSGTTPRSNGSDAVGSRNSSCSASRSSCCGDGTPCQATLGDSEFAGTACCGSDSGSDGPKGSSPAPLTAVPAPVLAHALRALVNLTSHPRLGSPVRQAVLRNKRAIAALLRLLQVQEGLPVQEGLSGAAMAALTPEGFIDDDDDDYMDDNAAADGGSAVVCDASGSPGGGSSSSGGLQPGLQHGLGGICVAPAAAWQLAGLAAWLLAHLCSMPAGQIQLVHEGVVPLLVRLVRQGRVSWGAIAAAAASNCGAAAGGANEERCDPRVGQAGRADPRPSPADAGAASPLSSASTATPEAAAAGAGSGPAADLPYIFAAVQYGLMALVNITFDNSANQRAAAVAGALDELDLLFSALLRPGVLLELSPPPPRQPQPQPGSAAAAAEGTVGAGPSTGAEAASGGVGRRKSARVVEVPGGAGGCGRGGQEAGQDDEAALLRTCSQGVAKFAVWLLAHLSSSDPDLKAAISASAYGFLPKLLSFLMLGERQVEAEEPADGEAPQWPQTGIPPHQAPHHHRHQNHDTQQQHTSQGGALPNLQPHESNLVQAAARTGDEPAPATAAMPAAAAVSSPAVIAVRQYAAMALVNLTCGVPSTKAAVARAMDWGALARLLGWLAEVATEGAAGADAAVEGQEATAAAAPPPPLPPTSDLLLYTVWLLQHLSLSPVAAAAADPRVVPPLVALLAAPEPHVRLRAAAAVGALCSSPSPPPSPPPSPSAAGSPSAPPPLQQQQRHLAHPQPHPHRAAFLAADGVRRLLAAARSERDPHLLAYDMLCLSSGVGDDDVAAVVEAVAGGALELLEELLGWDHAACLIPGAEALQGLARAARIGLRRYAGPGARGPPATAAAVAAVAAAADHVPRSLLSRVVAVMLTHGDPRVRAAMDDALGSLTALPGVRDRYCAVFAETLRDLVTAAEVELQVIPVS